MMRIRRQQVSKQSGWSLKRSGTAMVEMAMVLPVFVTMMLGIIEFGRAIMVGQLVVDSAREGARLGVLDGSTNSAVQSSITTFLQSAANIAPANVTTTITVNGSSGDVSTAKSRDLITVNISVPFSKVSYLPPTFLSGVNLTGQSSMRHE